MNILFVYDDKSMVYQTQRVIAEHSLLLCEYCNLEKIADKLVDIVIMPVLSVKCRWNAPILAILEDKSIENHLAILSMGVLEYLERPVLDEKYKEKVEEMIRWKWFLEKQESPE